MGILVPISLSRLVQNFFLKKMPVLIAKVLLASNFNCNSQMVGLAVFHDKEKNHFNSRSTASLQISISFYKILGHYEEQMADVNLRGVGRVGEALKHLPRRGRRDCGLLLIAKIKLREILKASRKFSHPQLWLEYALSHGVCPVSASGAPQMGVRGSFVSFGIKEKHTVFMEILPPQILQFTPSSAHTRVLRASFGFGPAGC